jgi:hypothetical protein
MTTRYKVTVSMPNNTKSPITLPTGYFPVNHPIFFIFYITSKLYLSHGMSRQYSVSCSQNGIYDPLSKLESALFFFLLSILTDCYHSHFFLGGVKAGTVRRLYCRYRDQANSAVGTAGALTSYRFANPIFPKLSTHLK